jgi:hypothetical protein
MVMENIVSEMEEMTHIVAPTLKANSRIILPARPSIGLNRVLDASHLADDLRAENGVPNMLQDRDDMSNGRIEKQDKKK